MTKAEELAQWLAEGYLQLARNNGGYPKLTCRRGACRGRGGRAFAGDHPAEDGFPSGTGR